MTFEHKLLDGTVARIACEVDASHGVVLVVMGYAAELRLRERSLGYPVRDIEAWVSAQVGRPVRWECSTVYDEEDGRAVEVWRMMEG